MKITLQFNVQMTVMPLVYICLGVLSACAQGTIDFRNTGGTPISTNDLQGNTGLISGPGNYRFGLYLGPLGNNADTFLLSGLAINNSTAGLFGSSSSPIPIGFPVGTQVSFEVRGWSSFAGNTYEQALTYAAGGNFPPAYLGKSTLGIFTVPSSGSVILFGAGGVGGFELTPIPEPSSAVLGVLGLGFLSYTLTRKRGLTPRVAWSGARREG